MGDVVSLSEYRADRERGVGALAAERAERLAGILEHPAASG